ECEMQVMDGFDATRRIRDIERVMRRDHHSEHSHTPIVALTAHALAEVRERCLDAGMDDFLVKPYDEMQIADMLGRWLTPITGVSTAPSDNSAPEKAQPPPSSHAPKLDMVAVDRIRRNSDDDGSSMLVQGLSQF